MARYFVLFMLIVLLVAFAFAKPIIPAYSTKVVRMEELNRNQELGLDSRPPQEQVFSNPLLVDNIWKHLESQDLIRASLVNKAWFIKSRETLMKGNKNNKYPLCVYIQIDNINYCPCEELVKFQKCLEEDYSSKSIPIIFNGIQVVEKYGFNLTRQKCLRRPFGKKLPRDIQSTYEVSIAHDFTSNVANPGSCGNEIHIPTMFGKILEKIKLKYLRLESYSYNDFCLFSKFLNFVITIDAENLLELTLNWDGGQTFVWDFFMRQHSSEAAGRVKFTNLQVLGIPEIDYHTRWSGLQTILPSLKRLNLRQLNPASLHYYDFDQDFPFYAIVNLGDLEQNEETVEATVEFIKKYEPKIESLSFKQNSEDRETKEVNSEELKRDLFQIGHLISNSLHTLTCSPSFLLFLAGEFDTFDGRWLKNVFPDLKTLSLMGSIGVNVMDWFGLEEFGTVFPNLGKIRINFGHLKPEHHVLAVNGPYNSVQRTRCFKSVTVLVLEASKVNDVTMEFVSRWLNLFANITHMNLVGMPFKYDRDDRAFAGIWAEINNLFLLEELTIRSDDLRSFSLDHLFKENILEVSKILEASDLGQLLMYKTSLLDNKSLKKITIQGKAVCTPYRINYEKARCYSGQPPGAFLVSSRTAASIRRHRPGFKFSLIINSIVKCCCNGLFRPGGFRFDHLELHAHILSREIHERERRWEIEFLNLSSEADLEQQEILHI